MTLGRTFSVHGCPGPGRLEVCAEMLDPPVLRRCSDTEGAVTILWARALVSFIAGTALVALLTGIPTDVVPNDWYTRMTPVEGYAVPVWASVSVLSGILVASFWGVRTAVCPTRGSGAFGSVGAAFSWLAIGCPLCNKLVILAIGASGALTFFAPLQPWLAALSVGLLLASIAWRWRVLLAVWSVHPDSAALARRS